MQSQGWGEGRWWWSPSSPAPAHLHANCLDGQQEGTKRMQAGDVHQFLLVLLGSTGLHPLQQRVWLGAESIVKLGPGTSAPTALPTLPE